jgi:hypothetical protein
MVELFNGYMGMDVVARLRGLAVSLRNVSKLSVTATVAPITHARCHTPMRAVTWMGSHCSREDTLDTL